MRIRSLFLPVKTNSGADLFFELDCFRLELADMFSGWTETQTSVSEVSAKGFWRDETTGLEYRDELIEFRIGADWSEKLSPKRETTKADQLNRLGSRFARLMEQEAIFLIDENNTAHLLAPASPPAQSVRETWAQKNAA